MQRWSRLSSPYIEDDHRPDANQYRRVTRDCGHSTGDGQRLRTGDDQRLRTQYR
ncbi:unnamed protein product, partial [Staurois parvus]